MWFSFVLYLDNSQPNVLTSLFLCYGVSDGSFCCIDLFQQLLTDLAANAQVVDNINKMADQMVSEGHAETPYIKQRQRDINNR